MYFYLELFTYSQGDMASHVLPGALSNHLLGTKETIALALASVLY
jgi:hypothetical protein